jgi:sugar/nucleoside kinase (ribokinase family)
MSFLRPSKAGEFAYARLLGTGGIGTGMFFQLSGSHTLGRNESRLGMLLPNLDFCKLHIIAHYMAVLLGAGKGRFDVHALGKVGGDIAGRELVSMMQEAGIDVSSVDVLPNYPTLFSVCFQYPDTTGGNITSMNSASDQVSRQDATRFFARLPKDGKPEMILAAPEVPVEARIAMLSEGRRRGSFTAASVSSGEAAQFQEQGAWRDIDLLAVNIDEARAIAGIGEDCLSDEAAEACIRELVLHNPDMLIAITDGPKGSYGYHQGVSTFTPALPTKAIGTAGAGDAYVAGVMAGLCCGLPFLKQGRDTAFGGTPLSSAMELGTLLASFTVTSPDTIHMGANAAALFTYAEEKNVRFSPAFARMFDEERSL